MTDIKYALTHLYHPGTGAKVDIPLDLDAELTKAQAMTLIRSVDNLLASGFTVNQPGLEDGENFEQIGYVVRREKINDDGSATPIIDLYPAQGNFRILGIYLNSEADIAEFETACGVRVNKLPLYDGNPIERGKNPKHEHFVTALKSPAKLVYKHNPKWEGENDKKHPKRVFVRWEGLRPASTDTNGHSAPIPPAMTYEQAREVLTPNGSKLGNLSADQLTTLKTANNSKITAEMRQAAQVILEEIAKEGA